MVCILLLSPGIPEYLSGSSPLNALVLNPGMFLFQLLVNLGLYGPGILLIREAKVRWKVGWGPVLLLGAAYGILEEGIALSTLFNPEAGPVGALGTYGHWIGVSWVWLAGILPVHMIYSISLPILLLGLALPETEGRPFLKGRKLPAVLTVLGADVVALILLVTLGMKFWMGLPVLVGSVLAIAALIAAARRVGADFIHARPEARWGPRRAAVLGAAFFPSVLLTEFLVKGVGAPAAVDFFIVIALQGLFLYATPKVVGSAGNGRNLVAFAFGLVLPLASFGALSQASPPVILVADVVMVAFFRKLWLSRLDGHALASHRNATAERWKSAEEVFGRQIPPQDEPFVPMPAPPKDKSVNRQVVSCQRSRPSRQTTTSAPSAARHFPRIRGTTTS